MVDTQHFTWAVELSHGWHIDWTLVPDFIHMVLIKATEGDCMVDGFFQQHVEDALKAGRMVGFYHSYRTRIGERSVKAKAQADFFLHHTQPYWDDVSLRVNIFRRGDFESASKEYFNPRLGSESEDLFAFHQRLHHSDWLAFDLLNSSMATWQEMALENRENGWQGPGWMVDQPFIDGLWLTWRPYRRPRGPEALGKFIPGSFSPRLPRPFRQYWAWQFTSDFLLHGLYTRDGLINRLANLSVIPYPPEMVSQILAAYDLGESELLEIQNLVAAHRSESPGRLDRMREVLQQTGDQEAV